MGQPSHSPLPAPPTSRRSSASVYLPDLDEKTHETLLGYDSEFDDAVRASYTDAEPSTAIWQAGPWEWRWRSHGLLREARITGNYCEMPTQWPTTLGSGTTYTRWGAERLAWRAHKRWGR